MLIEQTKEMTERERIAVQNSNNQFLQAISYVAVGTIFSYAGKTVPETFMLCDGRSLDKTEYEELFNVIGYTFGGSGESFKLPDLRGKTLVGVSSADTNFDSVGKTGGAATHTLKENEMPSHKHYLFSSRVTTVTDNKDDYVRTWTVDGTDYPYAVRTTDVVADYGLSDTKGGDQPHNNMPPYLVCNYIIKVTNSVMKDDFRFPIDQTYSPESENAQSGKAVAEAISSIEVPGGGSSVPNVGKFIGEVIIDNDETRLIEWTECADGSPLNFDELLFVIEGGADTSRNIGFTTNNEYNSHAYNWSVMSSAGLNTNSVYLTLHCKMIGGRWVQLGYTSTNNIYNHPVNRPYNTTIQQGKQRCTTSLVVGLGWGHFTSGTKIAVYGR